MNIYTGQPWSQVAIFEIGNSLARGTPVDEIAEFICRAPWEVKRKVKELKEATLRAMRPKSLRAATTPWSQVEIFRTATLRAKGKTIAEVARHIGRGPQDVKDKLEELGFAAVPDQGGSIS